MIFLAIFEPNFNFRVPTTTHFSKVCCCMVLWVLFRVPTTTHFVKMCCCMVLWVLFRVLETTPTTPYNNTFQQNVLLYGVVGVATHNTIQQHILLKCVVVTVVCTRNNTHNTIQHTLLMLLLCVTYEPS